MVVSMGKYTLWVIFGPLAAEEVCAKKRKVAVKISSTEITTLWRLAILKNIHVRRLKQRRSSLSRGNIG